MLHNFKDPIVWTGRLAAFSSLSKHSIGLSFSWILHTGNISVDGMCGGGSLPKNASQVQTQTCPWFVPASVQSYKCALRRRPQRYCIWHYEESGQFGVSLTCLIFFIICHYRPSEYNKDKILDSSGGSFESSIESSLLLADAQRRWGKVCSLALLFA